MWSVNSELLYTVVEPSESETSKLGLVTSTPSHLARPFLLVLCWWSLHADEERKTDQGSRAQLVELIEKSYAILTWVWFCGWLGIFKFFYRPCCPPKRGCLLGMGTGGRGRKNEGLTADTAPKRPERPRTAARTMEVLRRCPLTIAQRLVHRAIALSTESLRQCPLHLQPSQSHRVIYQG